MKIPLTNNWGQNIDDVVGSVEFDNTAKAQFIYEMLRLRPDSFSFEIGYSIDEDGKYHLHEVSIVNKFPRYHPVVLKRRSEDFLRRSLRNIKRRYENGRY